MTEKTKDDLEAEMCFALMYAGHHTRQEFIEMDDETRKHELIKAIGSMPPLPHFSIVLDDALPAPKPSRWRQVQTWLKELSWRR